MNNTNKMILVISHFIMAFFLYYSLTGCTNNTQNTTTTSYQRNNKIDVKQFRSEERRVGKEC